MLPLFPGVYPTHEICSQVYVAWRVSKSAVNRDCEIDDTFIQILLLHQTAGWNGIKMFWPFFRIYIYAYYISIYTVGTLSLQRPETPETRPGGEDWIRSEPADKFLQILKFNLLANI